MPTEGHIDDALLARYFAGEASQQEKAQVRAWMLASDENLQEFDQLARLWSAEAASTVKPEQAWDKVQERIGKQGTRSFYFYFSRIAAVVVLAVAIYFLLKPLGNPKEEVFVAGNSTLTTTLADNSVISLNKHSTLIQTKDFNQQERVVRLQGEAFFDVEHAPEKPFIIRTGELTVTVLGTSFYVQAYDSLAYWEVGVEEGRVRVVDAGKEWILQKGEKLRFLPASQQAESGTYNPNQLFWKSGRLIYRQAKLAEVFREIEDAYGVSITVDNPDILRCRLTAKFSQDSIEDILEVIQTHFNLRYEKSGNTYTLFGDGCP